MGCWTPNARLFGMDASIGSIWHGRPGRCIYCGATDGLQTEHVIPYALNGDLLLQDASCARCAGITSAFERSVCRDALLTARAALGLRTRRKKQRPKTFPLTVEVGGKARDIQVPAEDQWVPLIFPLFAPPAFLTRQPYRGGISIDGVSVADRGGGKAIEDLDRRYGEGRWGFRLEYEPVAFARMIAKVAYGFAVGRVGLDEIEDAYVLPAILGERQDVGRWVGCDVGGETLNNEDGLHEIGLVLRGQMLHVVVRLFAQFGAEEYRVIVGRVSDKAATALRQKRAAL